MEAFSPEPLWREPFAYVCGFISRPVFVSSTGNEDQIIGKTHCVWVILCRSQLWSEGKKTTKNIQRSISPCFSALVLWSLSLPPLRTIRAPQSFHCREHFSRIQFGFRNSNCVEGCLLTLLLKNIKNNTIINRTWDWIIFTLLDARRKRFMTSALILLPYSFVPLLSVVLLCFLESTTRCKQVNWPLELID